MLLTKTKDIVKYLTKCGDKIAFDVETYECVPQGRPSLPKGALVLDRARVEVLSFAGEFDGGIQSFSIPVKERYGAEYVSTLEMIKSVRPFFENPDILKIAHNMNYDANVMANHGVNVINIYCTLVASRHQDENAPADLKNRAIHVGMFLKKYKSISPTDLVAFLDYAESDSVATYKLYKAFEEKPYALPIEEHNREILHNDELPLVSVIIGIERRGMLIDVKKMGGIHKVLTDRLIELETEIYAIRGKPFNINSNPQLQGVLYDEFKITPPPDSEIKTGYSTNEKTLSKIGEDAHPIVRCLLEYRTAEKLSKVVCPNKGLPAYADKDGYIHSTLSTTGAQTFRFSSSLPNLQNIPSQKDTYGIRKCFIAPPGYCMIVSDFSGIELNITGSVTQDPLMVEELSKRDGDLHQATADRLSTILTGAPGNFPRHVAKTINFGLLYGMGANKLAEQLTHQGFPTTKEDAWAYIDAYKKTFRRVFDVKEVVVDLYKKDGYIQYATGRRRTIPNMSSTNQNKKAFGERQVFNSLIQGTAADLIKQAILRCVNDASLRRWECFPVMTVHDEIVFYAKASPANNPRRCANRVRALMERPLENAVIPMVIPHYAEVGIGFSWADAK